MTKVEAVRRMLMVMNEDTDLNEALRMGALAILDDMEPKQKAEPVKEPEPTPKPIPKSGSGAPAKHIDVDKAITLRNAGWSLTKIAGELGCSAQTVANHLKKAGSK